MFKSQWSPNLLNLTEVLKELARSRSALQRLQCALKHTSHFFQLKYMIFYTAVLPSQQPSRRGDRKAQSKQISNCSLCMELPYRGIQATSVRCRKKQKNHQAIYNIRFRRLASVRRAGQNIRKKHQIQCRNFSACRVTTVFCTMAGIVKTAQLKHSYSSGFCTSF